MTRDIVDPFNSDVDAYGRYEYTDPERRSSAYANRRLSTVTLASLDCAGKRIVDVGCGDGTYTAVIRQESEAEFVLGIDPAAQAIESAAARYCGKLQRIEFRNAFAADLVEQGEHFDVAVYRGVIHHTADPAAEIKTALRLADTVFFIEPNGWNFVVKLLEKYSDYHRRHGERSFRAGQLRQWIEAGGGKVDRAFYFGLVPFFCPDWFVALGASLEPVVERVPLVRMLCCGQIGICASRRS